MYFPVVFQDEHLIAVSKPHKLLSVPGLSEPMNLFDEVLKKFPNARTIHRLDMATSGLILFALHYEAQKRISQQFEHKTLQKRYVALVNGRIEAKHGEWVLPLAPSLSEKTRHCVDWVRGKHAHTRFEVTARSDRYSRLRLYPVTGRSHQLRVHCLFAGHPIIGDPFYGCEAESNRLMLHAETIVFKHPISARRMVLTSPSPF